ncbi:unnamed protein product [Onchocerca flexuosa]|uniref:Bifunctional lysine-specific demethylase and histidyl-hydroxylase n=1 Tax=Onchocerca flexuosa TaxID=387005 RepID=A0A183H0V6_9BILA|nr:unnamed protein product [Onchocerca flexuosa]
MTIPSSNDRSKNGKACKNFIERNENALVSSFLSKNADKCGEKTNKINETKNKERKLTKKEIQEGNKRKRKSVDKGELNGSAITQSQVHSNDSVFSSLFREYDRSEKMQNSLKHNISDKALQSFGKKGKRKMQKKIQKIVHNGEVVDCLNEEEETEENKILILPDSKDEKFFEVDETGGKEKGMKNREEYGGKFQLHDGIRVSSSFLDDVEIKHNLFLLFQINFLKLHLNNGYIFIQSRIMRISDEENQERTADTMVYENFVKCYRTKNNGNVHGAIIDFEQKPFSAHSDSIQNGLDAMQWLIDPYNIKQFFKAIFQKKVFYMCRNNPSYYGNLFSTAKFIDILRADYVEYGTNVNVAIYKNQQRSTLNGSGKVYPQEIQKSIKAGCSIQFTNPQSFCDNVWYFCDLLQEIFGCFVGANTYITPANTAGFAPHWDDIDAFLLQLEGRKHWKVYAPIDDSEMLPRLPSGNFTDDDMTNRTPVFDDWLEQGDLLYIPRGFIHQGFADKDVHSLHLTVSVCRNVTYADLLERVVPLALSSFAEQHVNIRKSLPAGYLDMTGVLECDYPLFKTGALKLDRFLDAIFSNFCNYIKGLIESAVDMMAREFMKTALPPLLTKEEKDMTVSRIVGSSLYDDKQHIFTKDTAIKLLRRHGQRLIYESEERCFIVHRMANSRVYEGRPEVLFDMDVKLAEGFANLMDAYPQWCLVSDLKCDTVVDSIRLAELLYSNGLLMAKFPKIV